MTPEVVPGGTVPGPPGGRAWAGGLGAVGGAVPAPIGPVPTAPNGE